MIGLYIKFIKARRKSAPEEAFKAELRAELMKRIDATHVYRTTPLFRYAFAPLALALLLGVGTASYAYASPSVSEGHMLFPLKEGVENVEKNFYRTPEAKVYYQVRVLHRRADEARYMIDRGNPTVIILERVPQAVQITEEQIEAAKKAKELEDEHRKAAREETKAVLQDFRKKVENAAIEETQREQVLERIDFQLMMLERME